jgi:hypothetical protein
MKIKHKTQQQQFLFKKLAIYSLPFRAASERQKVFLYCVQVEIFLWRTQHCRHKEMLMEVLTERGQTTRAQWSIASSIALHRCLLRVHCLLPHSQSD